MTGESLNDLSRSFGIQQDKIEKLKQLFPETITEGKIDWEKLQATLGKENLEFQNERYVLNWAGKTEAFKVLQLSTTATLKPCPGEGINDFPVFNNHGNHENQINHSSDNVFIEGENLEVLKVLQKAYYGKIKCIIIDPPYNTGNDSFIYPDSFKESKEDYQKRIGDKDEEGYLLKEGFFRKNNKDSGHYHSNWLSMMYPRLFLAKNLLRDDGVIFIHIDDNEVHNLRLVMNEIFGEENFVATYLWKKKGTTTNVEGAKVSSLTEYILCYCRTEHSDSLNYRVVPKESRNYEFSDVEGNYRNTVIEKKNTGSYERKSMQFEILGNKPREGKRWQLGEKTARELEAKDRFIIEDGVIKLKIYDFEDRDTTSANPNILFEHGSTDSASKDLESLFGVRDLFDNPKPYELIRQLIKYSQSESSDDIILDFFAGSATTAQAVLELNKEDLPASGQAGGGNRKFILVQLPEKCDEESEAYKAGYKTIADIAKERIRRVIKKIEKECHAERSEASKKAGLFAEDSSPDIHRDQNDNMNLGFKVFKLSSSNFKIWRGSEITEENLETTLELFVDPVRPASAIATAGREGSEKENMLYELILKAGYLLTDKVEYVNWAKAQLSVPDSVTPDLSLGLKQTPKSPGFSPKENGGYYSINNGELIIALEEMNQELIDKIISAKPKKVITLDKLFTDNDQLKTNTVLQMRDAEIDFKTI